MEPFKFQLKGGRSYVHGSDIYNSVFEYLESRHSTGIGPIDLWIRKISRHNMIGQILDVGEAADFQPVVTCRFEANAHIQKLYLYEGEEFITGRYKYDEERITNNAVIFLERREVHLRRQLPFTMIELVIALNKVLVQELLQPRSGKWYFTRLKLNQPLARAYESDITVSFDRNFGLHLTRSKVSIDGIYYGNIFFSLVEGKVS